MAAKKGDDKPKRDPLADEIDALLKKLPHAEPEPSAPKMAPPPRPAPAPSPGRPPAPRPSATGRPPLGVWAQVAAAMVLAAAFTQWPYEAACGWGLLGYGSAVTALLIVGGWCVTEAWRARLAAAHVVSLIVVFWGIALAAEVVLPRIGYAAESATWRCTVEAPAAVPARTAPAAAPVDQPDPAAAPAASADSVADSTAAGDSATVEAETSPDSAQG